MSKITREQSNEVCNTLEKVETAHLIDMARAVKEIIIHAAVNLPDDSVQKAMITDDMKIAKQASDLLDKLSGLLYKP